MLIGYPVPPTRAVLLDLDHATSASLSERRGTASVPEFRYIPAIGCPDTGHRQQHTDCSAGTALQIILRHRSDHAGAVIC